MVVFCGWIRLNYNNGHHGQWNCPKPLDSRHVKLYRWLTETISAFKMRHQHGRRERRHERKKEGGEERERPGMPSAGHWDWLQEPHPPPGEREKGEEEGREVGQTEGRRGWGQGGWPLSRPSLSFPFFGSPSPMLHRSSGGLYSHHWPPHSLPLLSFPPLFSSLQFSLSLAPFVVSVHAQHKIAQGRTKPCC